jgi:hypothetical protein
VEAALSLEPVAALVARFAGLWWAAIAEEAPRFGDDEKALLKLDVELNAQGLAYVSSSLRAAPPAA